MIGDSSKGSASILDIFADVVLAEAALDILFSVTKVITYLFDKIMVEVKAAAICHNI